MKKLEKKYIKDSKKTVGLHNTPLIQRGRILKNNQFKKKYNFRNRNYKHSQKHYKRGKQFMTQLEQFRFDVVKSQALRRAPRKLKRRILKKIVNHNYLVSNIKNMGESKNLLQKGFFSTYTINKFKTKTSRIEKLINLLMRGGKKSHIRITIRRILARISEAFNYASSRTLFESALARLEPIVDWKKLKQRRRKAGSRKKGSKEEEIIPIPCDFKRRRKYGLLFFIKGVRLRQQKEQINFEEAIFYELVAIISGSVRSYSFDIKREHLFKILQKKKLIHNRKIPI